MKKMIQKNNPGWLNRNRRAYKQDRPIIKPEITPVDWLLEGVALIGLLILLGMTVYEYPRLPDTIPSHFNAAGLPDDYSSRDSFLFLPGIDIFIYSENMYTHYI